MTVPLPDGDFNEADIASVLAQFHREHDRAYGFNAPAEAVEFVTLRLTAVGLIAKPRLREIAANGQAPITAQKAVRSVYFAERDGFVDCGVYDRYLLRAGSILPGPAIVEEMDSTTVIHPDYQAAVDRYGNLLLTRMGTA